MSTNQHSNRLLLTQAAQSASTSGTSNAATKGANNNNNNNNNTSENNTNTNYDQQDSSNQFSVDTDFDSYWEEEARYPHRNRIRIGRQYQATVPPLLKSADKDPRKLEDLETLSFCPKRSARVSNAELDHYFTVAKSLNLFASLVETRSLLGRDVTIADLNHIRHKEGLSLASVIQPVRQAAVTAMNNITTSASSSSTTTPSSSSATQQAQAIYPPQVNPPASSLSSNNNNLSQQQSSVQSTSSPTNATSPTSQKSPPNIETNPQQQSPNQATTNEHQHNSNQAVSSACQIVENVAINQPLMKALSHFISLHHPCHHDSNCKKLLKDIPLEDDSTPTVSITAGNLRYGSSNSKRARTAAKQQQLQQQIAKTEISNTSEPTSEQQSTSSRNVAGDATSAPQQQSPSYEDWTREEVELFSKAIEVCGKNFGSIKKEFLPTKSVKSIVEYYYIGSRDVSDSRKQKSYQSSDAHEACSGPEKSTTGNGGNGKNGGGGGPGPTSSSNPPSASSSGPSTNVVSTNSTAPQVATTSSRTTTTNTSTMNENSKSNSKSSMSHIYGNERKPDVDIKSGNVIIPPLQSSNNKPTKNNPLTSGSVESQNDSNDSKSKQAKNIDARMSVYNFDDDFKDESPVRFECPRPGAEVKPLKAKPIIPNSSNEADPTNSNVGSLKFFMDGQLVLKLNARQEQQEGIERCHWVPSGDKMSTTNRQKRYTKRSSDRLTSSNDQTSSQSSSVISSNQDEDSKNNEDLSGDEDSKESMNSFNNSTLTNVSSLSINPNPPITNANTQISPASTQPSPRNQSSTSSTPRSRNKPKGSPSAMNHQAADTSVPTSPIQQGPPQLSSPIDYNRLAINNRMKEFKDNLFAPQAMNQANPWLQANSFAVAAALLGRIPFPPGPAGGLIDNPATMLGANSSQMNMHNASNVINSNNISPNSMIGNNISNVNMSYPSSKPMDLSVEHNPIPSAPSAKPVPAAKPPRSRARPKNNH